jgi:hypothetical protein
MGLKLKERIKIAVAKIKSKKTVGIILIILGLILHLIPLFPAGWIIVLGLEVLGIRLLLQDKIKDWLKKSKIYQKIKEIVLAHRQDGNI